jgi:hypothetical protein
VLSSPPLLRKYLDCREFNSLGGCSLRISGTETEVLAAAVEHAVSAHGYRGWEELRLVLRAALRNEERQPR